MHLRTRGEPPDSDTDTLRTGDRHTNSIVLITLHRNPELRQRDIAHAVGITVGAVQKILHELEDAGFVARERVGRRNRYQVNSDIPLRHPLENGHSVSDLLVAVD